MAIAFAGVRSIFLVAWPWANFALACLGRAFWGSYLFLMLEGKVIGLAPIFLRSFCFYGAASFVATWVIRQVCGALTIGPTPDTQVHAESGLFRNNSVSWVTCAMRGWRDAMEDAHVAEQLACDVFEDALLFAVLDGHGGSEVSALASQLLVRELEAHGRMCKHSSDSQASALEEALTQALPNLDARLRGNAWGLGWLLPGLLHPFAHCGSTAVVAAVDFVGREVVVANVGDSRALLIRDGKAIALSEDHKPEDPKERSRIRAAGGQVIKMGPCHRVDGNLNLSRALGDFHLKCNLDLPPEKQKVIACPDITRTAFKGGSSELLLIGCDGLFERFNNQDVADKVWPRYKDGVALSRIASELLHACCARASRGRPVEEGTDNETVILVQLPEAKGISPDDDSSATDAETVASFVGQRVRVHGLVSEAGQALNGLEGIVEGPGTSAGRCSVCLSDGGGSKSLKPENLQRLDR